jgi:hypothetical protein
MKSRHGYALLCLPLAATFSGVMALALTAVAAGAMWIFVYGDDPWPNAAGNALVVLGVFAFASILVTVLRALYSFGQRQESRGGLNRKHVLVALAATVLLPLLIVLRLWSIGGRW